jgi:hypothetical protein
MKRVIAGLAAVAALVVAQGALAANTGAANTGTISVSHDPMVLAGSRSTTIHVTLPQADDPIAAINIYAPSGYTTNLSQAPGTTIGTVDATAFSHAAGIPVPLSGNVVVASPASFTQQSAQCAGVPTSAAVWLLNLAIQSQTIQVPAYVNPTAGAEQALGAEKISVCLTPWDVPEALGGAPQGAQVLDVRFTVNGVFTTPTGGNLLRWDTLFTPYTPGTGKPSLAGTFEARAFVPLPLVLGLHPTYASKTNTFRLSGTVTEAGLAVPDLTVHISRGIAPARLTQQSATRTGSNGAYRTAGHLKPRRTTYFRINASMPQRDFAAGCQSPAPAAIAPGGCVSATLSGWSVKSAVLRLTVPKAHKK